MDREKLYYDIDSDDELSDQEKREIYRSEIDREEEENENQ
jgi:hypothetical protein